MQGEGEDVALAGRALREKAPLQPAAYAIAVLFTCESFARALLMTVMPLDGLRLWSEAQLVSVAFFAAGLCSLTAGFLVPRLVARFGRAAVYVTAGTLLAVASLVMAAQTAWAYPLGMAARAVAVVALGICQSLLIMQTVPREELTRSEPLRLFWSAPAWTFGPVAGVTLAGWLGHPAPYLLSALVALLLVALTLRQERRTPPQRRAPNWSAGVHQSVRRYLRQKRLVLAWVLGLGRFGWWQIFFIYMPIFCVETGLGGWIGGLLAAAGSAFLFLTPWFGRVVRRLGLRLTFASCFAISAACTLAIAASFAVPWVGLAACLGGALAMAVLDGCGNVLFLTAVHPHEREAMTSVYAAHREVGNLAVPGAFALILLVLPLPAVFVLGGIAHAGLAVLSLRIHPRLGRGQRAT